MNEKLSTTVTLRRGLVVPKTLLRRSKTFCFCTPLSAFMFGLVLKERSDMSTDCITARAFSRPKMQERLLRDTLQYTSFSSDQHSKRSKMQVVWFLQLITGKLRLIFGFRKQEEKVSTRSLVTEAYT